MSFRRELKRRAKAALPPLVFLLVVAYFAWNATQGDLGLRSYAAREQDLLAAQATLATATAEMQTWERRVAALRPSHLDPDALDERTRAMLNVADPADIVVQYSTDPHAR
ncbi:MAG: septum formation initiator family protein [Acidisphaera sp.]|nr:septum formation initiator family protein [Acidisphaera sp.]